MAKVTIATVDATASEAITEAFEDAGIPLATVGVRPFKQLEYLRHQHRPLVDIDVDEEHAVEARQVLERLAADAEVALMAQAGGAPGPELGVDDGAPDGDDAEESDMDAPGNSMSAAAAQKLDPERSRGRGFLISLLVPVAGPIYAGSSRLVLLSLFLHGAALVMYLVTSSTGWYRADLHLDLAWMIFFVARIVDVVGTQQTISHHNAQVDQRPRRVYGVDDDAS